MLYALFVLIPALWLALVLAGLAIFRAAARSDASQAPALAAWLRLALEEDEALSPATAEQRLPGDPGFGTFRAAG